MQFGLLGIALATMYQKRRNAVHFTVHQRTFTTRESASPAAPCSPLLSAPKQHIFTVSK